MEKLTDEHLIYWQSWAETNPGLKGEVMLSLIAEVREGRRVVEIKKKRTRFWYDCPSCKENRIDCPVNEEKPPQYCCMCGTKLTWKD